MEAKKTTALSIFAIALSTTSFVSKTLQLERGVYQHDAIR